MQEPKDKRTTAYKEWKAKQNTQTFTIKTGNHNQKLDIPDEIINELIKPRGLGDTIEKITEATGIKKVVKAIFGDDCGCDERRDRLNEKYTKARPAERCFTETLYDRYKAYRERRTLNHWNQIDIDVLIDCYAHIFAIQYFSKDLCRTC